MARFNLVYLPREILEEIFSYLSLKDLLKTTEVCRLFNEIVGSTSNLMKNINVCWEGNDANVLLDSQRRYQKISIKLNRSLRSLEKFLELNAASISTLKLFDCKLKASDLGCILNHVKYNLQHILFRGVVFENDIEASPINMRKINRIDIFRSEPFSAVAGYFKNCVTIDTVHFFVHTCGDSIIDVEESQKISELLVSLDELKDLRLCNCLSRRLFANDDFTNASKFKLIKFGAEPVYYPYSLAALYSFIKKQNINLWSLDLTGLSVNEDFLEMILNIDGLYELSLSDAKFKIYREIKAQNTSLKIFTILIEWIRQRYSMTRGVHEILKNCPNLKELHLHCFDVENEIIFDILNMKNLELLHLNMHKTEPFSFPNITSMELFGFNFDGILKHIKKNPQLKYVKLYKEIIEHSDYDRTIQESNIQTVEFWD